MRNLLAIAACGVALLFAGSAPAQIRRADASVLADTRPAAQASAAQRQRVQLLQSQPGAGQLNIARVQTEALRTSNVGQALQFRVTPQSTITARALSVETANGVTTWQGEVAGDASRPPGAATLTVTQAGVTGTIHGADGRTYRLRPLPGGDTAIIELNYSSLPRDHEDSGSGGGGGGVAQLRNPSLRTQVNPQITQPANPNIRVTPDLRTNPNVTQSPNVIAPIDNRAVVAPADNLSDTNVARRLDANADLLRFATIRSNISLVERWRLRREIWEILRPPTIDLLVVYTSAAQTNSGDINGLITQAVSETNGSFTNSNVWARVRLVGTMATSYNESGRSFPTMVSDLMGTSDGQIDNVHAQRDAVRADVVVLVMNQPSACGRAAEIGANASQAFVVVHWDCATGYYSFSHEIAHLLGARHDEPTDTTDTPYAWGHGFRHRAAAPNGWRTIMGYNCDDGTCAPRLQYWSTPLTTYNGIAMGTAADADNRRVWNERAATVAAFR